MRVGSTRSIIQRKVLTPNDRTTLDELIGRILAFGRRYSALQKPFSWGFTRKDSMFCPSVTACALTGTYAGHKVVVQSEAVRRRVGWAR
jgi:hypothetical protein